MPRRSGLSDGRLAELWAEMRELYPDACDALASAPSVEDEEDGKLRTSFIQVYLHLNHQMVDWRERQQVYRDLLDFYESQRGGEEPSRE